MTWSQRVWNIYVMEEITYSLNLQKTVPSIKVEPSNALISTVTYLGTSLLCCIYCLTFVSIISDSFAFVTSTYLSIYERQRNVIVEKCQR